jgi:hypothetical protein
LKKICLGLFIITAVFIQSCDILRLIPFEVESCTPSAGYHSDPLDIVISLEFSLEPDKNSVERYFSLSDELGRINGAFSWKDKTMFFNPLLPLEVNYDYTIYISSEAHDINGLSMDSPFERKFTTRIDNVRPYIVSCYPQMYEEVIDAEVKIQIEFSKSIPVSSAYSGISISPAINGYWSLENDSKTAVFTPAEQWVSNKRYEIKVSGTLTDDYRNALGKDFISIFYAGDDHEKPSLLSASRVDKYGNYTLLRNNSVNSNYLSPYVENDSWEKDDKFSLVFSKPVDGLTVKNCLSCDGLSVPVMASLPDFKTEFIFTFENNPPFESRFVFNLKPGVKDNSGNETDTGYSYRIFANGKFSKPPSLAGIRIPLSPGSIGDKELVSVDYDSIYKNIAIKDGIDNYPPGVSVKTFIELYFLTADSAFIDPLSVMEYFRIETSNNVLSFSPRQIKTENFTIANPEGEWDTLERLEVSGYLVNSTNFGVINVIISPGLKDSYGNKNEKTQMISLIK